MIYKRYGTRHACRTMTLGVAKKLVITKDDVKKSMNILKYNKAPETDEISNEFVKYGTGELANVLISLFNIILENQKLLIKSISIPKHTNCKVQKWGEERSREL